MPTEDSPRAAAERAASGRVRLARTALEAALAVPGIRGADAGPAGLHVTATGDERLEGVTCSASSQGGYGVSLQLVCDLLPLQALSARVQKAVASAVARAGVAESLDDLEVRFSDLDPSGGFA